MSGQIFFNFYISTMIASYFPIYRGGGVVWSDVGKLWVIKSSFQSVGLGVSRAAKVGRWSADGRQIKDYFAIVENCPWLILLPVVGSCANDSRKSLKTRLKWLYRVHLAGRADMCGESSEQGTKNAPSEGWGVHLVGVR